MDLGITLPVALLEEKTPKLTDFKLKDLTISDQTNEVIEIATVEQEHIVVQGTHM